MDSKSQFPPDDEIMIIDDDSDEEQSGNNEDSRSSSAARSSTDSSEQTSCKNPLHDKWGNNDTNYRWPSQVSAAIQTIFRHLGYERAPGSRCKFCETCVQKAKSLTEEEVTEIEKNSKIYKMRRKQAETNTLQAQLEKLEQMDISEEEKAIQAKQLRMLAFVNPGKFMEDFDPETSTREMKKMNRRIYKEKSVRKNALYDETGKLMINGKDLCDCLDISCPGCHFPCPKCESEKCGMDCRCNRRWIYEFVESEGTGKTVSWPQD